MTNLQRQIFAQKESRDIYYLPVDGVNDAILAAAQKIADQQIGHTLVSNMGGIDTTGIRVEFRHSHSVEATLYIRHAYTNVTEGDGQKLVSYQTTAEITIGGTGRNMSETVALANLVGELAKIGTCAENLTAGQITGKLYTPEK